MDVSLLDRAAVLNTLDDSACSVDEGDGQVSLVLGEAGIGSTMSISLLVKSVPVGDT
jgi:predicted ATPase